MCVLCVLFFLLCAQSVGWVGVGGHEKKFTHKKKNERKQAKKNHQMNRKAVNFRNPLKKKKTRTHNDTER